MLELNHSENKITNNPNISRKSERSTEFKKQKTKKQKLSAKRCEIVCFISV